MSSLLHIASRVEAASAAYNSVKDFANKDEWKAKFKAERKATINEYRRVLKENGKPPLHPILVALTIVLDQDEDLGNITRSHPKRAQHTFYNPEAEFADDLSGLLPGEAERWWDQLGFYRKAEADRKENERNNPPPPPQPPTRRKVKLIVPEPARNPEGDEDVEMEVDESEIDELDEDSQDCGKSKVSKGAAATRKRKGSSVGAPGTAKRRARSRQRPGSAEKGSRGSNEDDPVEEGLGGTPTIQCEKCTKAGERCIVIPDGPCQRCKLKKQGCSLMPLNPSTGKTDRHPLSEEVLLEFRLSQAESSHAGVKKGKGHAHDSPGPVEGDTSNPSPSVALANLKALTLDSGSSHANTPHDSPATMSQPPLPEPPASAPLPVTKTRAASKASRRKSVSKPPAAAPTQPLAGSSQLLKPALRQASRSSGDVSPASDEGSIEARIAALESRVNDIQAEVKTWTQEFDHRLKKIGA